MATRLLCSRSDYFSPETGELVNISSLRLIESFNAMGLSEEQIKQRVDEIDAPNLYYTQIGPSNMVCVYKLKK